ncbi:hypothetical protein [Bacillus suaedaesalsae]|nr:hypothetical protein [Bacillus suaedaesalsae]
MSEQYLQIRGSPQAFDELLMKYIPHATLEVLHNCGHWTVVE